MGKAVPWPQSPSSPESGVPTLHFPGWGGRGCRASGKACCVIIVPEPALLLSFLLKLQLKG